MEPENHADTPTSAGASPHVTELPSDSETKVGAGVSAEADVTAISVPSTLSEETPAPDSSPEPEHASAEDSVGESQPPAEPGSLEYFAQRSQGMRLSAEEENQAGSLLHELLLGGRADVSRALQSILVLPWMVSAQGTTRAWPEMKPTFRSQLLAGLARTPGEPAARVRLSLARALFKVDQNASLKLILLTLKVLRNKETGLLHGRGPNLLSNVLIGKGKAWLLQLPLESLKPAELDLLVFSAVHGAFHAPLPPLTQIGILRWAAKCERLSKLPATLEQLVLRCIQRWSGKWQSVLRNEVQSLPDSWYANLKIGAPSATRTKDLPKHANGDSHPEDAAHQEQREEGKNHRRTNSALLKKPRPTSDVENAFEAPPLEESASNDETLAESKSTHGQLEESDIGESEHNFPPEEDIGDKDTEEDFEDEEGATPSPVPKQRPVYHSKTVQRQGGASLGEQDRAVSNRRQGSFNLQEALRQIDAYANGLKTELAAAQKQLRQCEPDRRARRFEKPAAIPGEPSLEELNRLNQQLEFRNAELSARIEELTLDSEQRAASRNLIESSGSAQDAASELKALLSLKLREDFEDFQALEQEKKDLVVQQHYRSLLQHIFEVLTQEGVSFSAPASGE